jgi:hypothetical protein
LIFFPIFCIFRTTFWIIFYIFLYFLCHFFVLIWVFLYFSYHFFDYFLCHFFVFFDQHFWLYISIRIITRTIKRLKSRSIIHFWPNLAQICQLYAKHNQI